MDCRFPDKTKYTSRSRAKQHLKLQQGRGRLRDGHLRVYLCDCGYYHLGRLHPDVVHGTQVLRAKRVPGR